MKLQLSQATSRSAVEVWYKETKMTKFFAIEHLQLRINWYLIAMPLNYIWIFLFYYMSANAFSAILFDEKVSMYLRSMMQ